MWLLWQHAATLTFDVVHSSTRRSLNEGGRFIAQTETEREVHLNINSNKEEPAWHHGNSQDQDCVLPVSGLDR